MIHIEQQRRRPVRSIGRLSGLGFDYYDLLDQAGREDCSPRDSNCVARNQERVTAVQDLWATQYMTHSETANQAAPQITIHVDTSDAAYNAFMANAPLTSATISAGAGPTYSIAQLEQPRAIASTALPGAGGGTAALPRGQAGDGRPATYAPHVTFTNTSGGSNSALRSGDYWKIEITGGAPSTPVWVTGGKDGARDRSPAGSTDASGSLKLTGTLTDSEIGPWKEDWAVGDTSAGSVAFTVAARSTAAIPGAGGTGSPPVDDDLTSKFHDLTGGAFKDLPWYAWAGGAAAVLTIGKMAFGGRGR